MRRTGGFSLIELVVSASIFMVLSATIFAFFRFGTRSFQSATAQQGLQSEALRVAEGLQTDLKRSGFGSVSFRNDTSRASIVDGNTVSRDVINFIGLQNWTVDPDDINYSIESGAPLWNRYWTYYATTDNPIGMLVRHKVDPNPPPHATTPMLTDQIDDMIFDDPLLNSFDGKTPEHSVLSKHVLSFSVNRTEAADGTLENPGQPTAPTGSFDLMLKLRKRHEREAGETGSRRDFDYYQIKFSIRPQNSFPRN